ncbi:MAG: methyl-accepting chemotaxis protein [Gammaproteobacteria bacterium]|nr:methyl-accepting chemotaxis protein [Gammaproteobacteria bacterium]
MAEERRHQLFVNKQFQYRYILLTASIAIILVNALTVIGILLYGPHIKGGIAWYHTAILAAIEAALLLAVFYFSARESHRLAGPMFAINRRLERLGDGDLHSRLSLRQGDHFHEIAEALNSSVGMLRQRIETIASLVDILNHHTDPDGEAGRALARLRVELEHLESAPPPDSGTAARR